MKYDVLSVMLSASILLANHPASTRPRLSYATQSTLVAPKLVSHLNYTSSLEETPEDKNLRRLKSAMNTTSPTVRNYAVKLAAKFPGKLNHRQIFNIYDDLWKNWKYVSDPKGMEYFASGSETIDNGLAEDCDDFAVLLAALLEAIGYTTRIAFAFGPDGGHAFTEVYMGNDIGSLKDKVADAVVNHYKGRKNLQGKRITIGFRNGPKNQLWLNLDWFAEYAGGPFFKSTKETVYYPREGRYAKRER